jgi:general secretion pathway protein J
MKKVLPTHHRARGFTLLEVLIAVLIFSIVLGAINTVFYAALRLRNKTTESIEKSIPLQQAVSIIKRDLANLMVPGGTLSGELNTALSISGMVGQSSPDFHTSSAVIDQTSPWSEVQKVSYYLSDSTNVVGRKDLFRLLNRNLLAPEEEIPVGQWLLSGVRNIYFLYLNGTQWQESWDSTTEDSIIPSAIRVLIEMDPDTDQASLSTLPASIEFVVPIVSQPRTNATEEASEP